MSEGEPKTNAEPELGLGPRLTRTGRVKYSRPLAELAEVYQVGVRTLKEWISEGKATSPPNFPPLDEPERMAGWWAAVKKHQIPKLLLDFQPVAPPAALAVVGEDSIDLDEFSDMGAPEELRQAKALKDAAYRQLQMAYTSGDASKVATWQERWSKASHHYRQARAAAREEARVSGRSLLIEDVAADLLELLRMLRAFRQSLPGRLKKKIGLTDEQIEAVRGELKQEETLLMNTKYLDRDDTAALLSQLTAA